MNEATKVKVYERYDKIYVSATIDGKRYKKSTGLVKSKRNLKYVENNALSVLLQLIDKKENLYNEKILFSDYAKNVLELTSKKRNENQQRDLLSLLKNHISPYFRYYMLKDVKTNDIEMFIKSFLNKINKNTGKTYSTSSAKKALYIISKTLEKAFSNDLVSKDYSSMVESIEQIHTKTQTYNINEIQSILKNSESWFKLFLHLLFCSAMRVGECIAVKISDFDFQYNALYLKRSITKGKISKSNLTKNHNRLIVLPNYLIKMVQEHIMENSLDQYLFISKRSRTCFKDSKAITNGYFKPLLKDLNIEYKTLEAFRHTSASILKNNGISQDFIQEQLGHSIGSAVTNRHYITLESNQHKVDMVNNIYENKLNLERLI